MLLGLGRTAYDITYSTITSVNPSRWSKRLGSTIFLINAICLNNKTRNYLIKRAEFCLRFLPIVTANLKASNSLLRRLRCLLQR
jgi:hypothetical protein